MNRHALVVLVLQVFFHPTILSAQWQPDGIAISMALKAQFNPAIASDGAGGAIMTWMDGRNDISDIYAQRVSASGTVLWTADGVAVCTVANSQCYPTITADGVGGAIIAWQDGRTYPQNDVYAQRLDASGALQWMTNGVPVSAAANDQCYPTIVADGVGGAVITWHDYRGGTDYDIYAQRVDGSGTRLWLADGVAVCSAAHDQQYPTIVSDGAQGAVATWYDLRSDSDYDIYVQRVSASGVAQWTSNGVALCTATRSQWYPTIVSDDAGGAIVTWFDARSPINANTDIYAQRVSGLGVVQWTTNGVALCIAPGGQLYPTIVSDEAGGAIVTWYDFRSASNYDIYAQRVSAPGVVQWATDGVALCVAAGDQYNPTCVPDGAGGAIVTWYDLRSANYDIYAQRVNAPGALQWLADGVPLSVAAGTQTDPAIVSDAVGGAIVTWADSRSGLSSDIYAQRVGPAGLTPTGVRDTPSMSAIALTPNYPNPFSSGTALDLSLNNDAVAEVQVFDAGGRRVRQIEMGRVRAGWRHLDFDGLDADGRPLPSGVYFYRVMVAGETITRKLVIVR